MAKITTNETQESPKSLETWKEREREYIVDLQRLQADFENYMKRGQKEKEESSNKAKYDLFLSFLTFFDNLERASKIIQQTPEKTQEGVQMILNQFTKILQEHNIKPIESIGQKSNPYLHDVIRKVESDEEEDIIVEETQKGYLIADKVLRPSRVIVSKGKAIQEEGRTYD